jgi:hypothetical protein
MTGGLFNIVFTDYTGSLPDFKFLKEDKWLEEAVVIPVVFMRKGSWYIRIQFVWQKNPFRFISKNINNAFHSEQKATVYARNYCQSIDNDYMSNKNIQTNAFTISYN